jgi:hypothetical protein
MAMTIRGATEGNISHSETSCSANQDSNQSPPEYDEKGLLLLFFIIWFVRLLALRPLLAYCASLG